jgi:hypothetical protein
MSFICSYEQIARKLEDAGYAVHRHNRKPGKPQMLKSANPA